MSEEVTNEAVVEEAAVEAVSDAAAEGVTEEVVEASATEAEISPEDAPQATQQVQPQEVLEEPEDNGVRSNLGRKVKYMEGKMDETLGKLDAFLQSQGQSQAQPQINDEEDYLSTKGEMRTFIQEESRRQQQADASSQDKYDQGFSNTVNQLGPDLSDLEHKEIYDEMRQNHWVRHSDNGVADAERNWQKAEIAVLRKRQANPVRKTPLLKEKPKAPLGGNSVQNVSGKKPKMPKFDEATLAYMKKTGMTEEKAAEILASAR